MSWRVVFARLADEEFDHAVGWYLAEAPHEVDHFAGSFEAAMDTIRQRPLLAKTAYGELRHVKTGAFPYHIWYRVLQDVQLVEVVAVLHGRQDWTRLGHR